MSKIENKKKTDKEISLDASSAQLIIREPKQQRRHREGKRHIKMTSQSFKLLSDYSDSFNLSNVVELSGADFVRTAL